MRLSIITVNLNNRIGLIKTIQSVLNQTFDDFEYIIIDGGSTDGSVDVIKQHVLRYSYWVSEKDKGIFNAMNKGIVKASGDYCLFLNSGDYLDSQKTLSEVFKLELNEDIVFGSIKNAYKDKVQLIEYPDEEYITFRHFIKSGLPHPGSFIKRNLFARTGLYDERYKVVNDWEFFLLAIFKHNATLKKIPIVISVFDMYGNSNLTDNLIVDQNERKEILEENFKRFLPDYSDLFKVESKYHKTFGYFLKSHLRRIR